MELFNSKRKFNSQNKSLNSRKKQSHDKNMKLSEFKATQVKKTRPDVIYSDVLKINSKI
jgi:hypothetical protein